MLSTRFLAARQARQPPVQQLVRQLPRAPIATVSIAAARQAQLPQSAEAPAAVPQPPGVPEVSRAEAPQRPEVEAVQVQAQAQVRGKGVNLVLPPLCVFCGGLTFILVRYPDSIHDKAWVQVRGVIVGFLVMAMISAAAFL